jgi:Flp pilus assembly protein TadG
MVESALALPIFLLLTLGSLDLFRLAYHAVTLHYVTSRTARWAILGQTLPSPSNPAVRLSREESIKLHLRAAAQKFGITLGTSSIRVCPTSDPACAFDSAGGANDQFILTVVHPVKGTVTGWKRSVTALMFARSEPYA